MNNASGKVKASSRRCCCSRCVLRPQRTETKAAPRGALLRSDLSISLLRCSHSQSHSQSTHR
ncbi:hypothetical protein EYF80_062971 [Liparis tanakae]|uniref:Uncharacterized protein n=1 Tax=Liparis tanakae TaxID=230148 RepID=A0A4Z2EDA0_9TELE|nr:hypothetical protein EYF80_062971 [Liparis tanakae]